MSASVLRTVVFTGLCFALVAGFGVRKNRSRAVRPPPPPDQRSARERAPIDITGQWVAVVTEDWRWRMVTPPVGDAASIPLNAEGPRGDGGVGSTSAIAAKATSAGRTVRRAAFASRRGCGSIGKTPTRCGCSSTPATRRAACTSKPVRRASRSLQGYSEAKWFRQTQSRGVFAAQTPADRRRAAGARPRT